MTKEEFELLEDGDRLAWGDIHGQCVNGFVRGRAPARRVHIDWEDWGSFKMPRSLHPDDPGFDKFIEVLTKLSYLQPSPCTSSPKDMIEEFMHPLGKTWTGYATNAKVDEMDLLLADVADDVYALKKLNEEFREIKTKFLWLQICVGLMILALITIISKFQ